MSEPARARRTDPGTSHAAARSVEKQRDSQRAVYRVLRDSGPMTDVALVAAYEQLARANKVPQQSQSGIRTRRDELVGQGWVRDTERKEKLPSGRMAILWEATSNPTQEPPVEPEQDALFDAPAPRQSKSPYDPFA